MTVEMMPSAREIALANVVVDIEKGAARVGWDHAPSIYALVPTAMLLADPNLPADIAEQLRAIDLNTITPLEAMRLLFELQQKARG